MSLKQAEEMRQINEMLARHRMPPAYSDREILAEVGLDRDAEVARMLREQAAHQIEVRARLVDRLWIWLEKTSPSL